MRKFLIFALAVFICTQIQAELKPDTAIDQQQGYLKINIDNVAIDTQHLTQVSENLAQSIGQLSTALEKLAADGTALKPEDRQALINATSSVNEASQSLTRLANQLPVLAEQVSETLPDTIKSSQQSIMQITQAIEAANRILNELTTRFPETLAQGENLLDHLLDSLFQKITFYSIVIILILFIGLSVSAYFGYRRVFQPLLAIVREFQALPQQMVELSLQNKQTSENLLALQSSLNEIEIVTDS